MNKLLLNLFAIAGFAAIGCHGYDTRVTFGDRFLKNVQSFTCLIHTLAALTPYKFTVATGYGYIKSVTRTDSVQAKPLQLITTGDDPNKSGYTDNYISWRTPGLCVARIIISDIVPRDTSTAAVTKIRELITPFIQPLKGKNLCGDHTDFRIGFHSDFSRMGDFSPDHKDVDDQEADAATLAANKAQDEVQAKPIPTPPAPALAAGTPTAVTTPAATTTTATITPSTTATITPTHAKSHGVKSRR